MEITMNERNFWFLRLGKEGQHEGDAIEKEIVSIDFDVREEPEKLKSRELVRGHIEQMRLNDSNQKKSKRVLQVHYFVNEMKEGDIVVCPFKTFGKKIYIGEIKSKCIKIGDFLTREVKWKMNEPLSRDRFQQDLLYAFGVLLTVSKLEKNDAPNRIMEMIKNAKDLKYIDKGEQAVIKSSQARKSRKKTEASESESEYEYTDLKALAIDQIRKQISSRFMGHRFEMLIEEILKAKGYETQRTSKGPDGGVDIVAGRGEFGFAEPRIIVQVKSKGEISNEREVFAGLEKLVRERKHAELGLFVSWQGFHPNIRKKTMKEFFNVRLWDEDKVMQELFEVYDKLPEDIKVELPLQRVWMLVPEPSEDS